MAKAKSTDAARNEQSETVELQAQTVKDLQAKYAEVCGESTRRRKKEWLIEQITARLAASKPKAKAERDPRLPKIGRTLTRTYKGDDYQVKVGREGFEFNGQTYRSLSAVANSITGSHINGFKFFGLAQK